MSVYRRKDSSYYWCSFTTPDGRRIHCSTEQTDKGLAEDVYAGLRKKVRERGTAALYLTPPTLQEFSVDFLKWVQQTQSLEPSTKRYYTSGWRLLKDTKLAAMRMDAITNHDCETVAFPDSPSNANIALRTLRRMYSLAQELKRIHEIPKIAMRKEWPRSIGMTEQQAEMIAARMPEGDARDAFLVLRGSGARPAEIFASRWEYVLWDKAILVNPAGKTSSSRRPVPLLGHAMEVLSRRHLEAGQPQEGWIFPTESKSGHIHSIRKRFSTARNACGFPKSLVLYTARHGFASDVAQVTTLKETMQLLGHTQASTAMRYQHVDMALLRAKLDSKPVM